MTIRHTPDVCLAPHDARAMDGLYLCQGCVNGIRRNLTRLPHLYEQLAEMHTTPAGNGSGRVSGTPEAKLPINPAIADHRHQIQHDLVWWCILVADERGISTPADSHPDVTAAWLQNHVNWLAARKETAEELPPVLRELAGRAGALAGYSTSKRVEIGPCRQGGCAGTLWATVRLEGDSRPSAIYCDGDECGFEKSPQEWLRFGREYRRSA